MLRRSFLKLLGLAPVAAPALASVPSAVPMAEFSAIADGFVTSEQIAAGSITANKINASGTQVFTADGFCLFDSAGVKRVMMGNIDALNDLVPDENDPRQLIIRESIIHG